MADSYGFLRLRGAGRDTGNLLEELRERTLPAWSADGLRCWGVWQGLFGIGSNELLVMAGAPGDRPDLDFRRALPADAEVIDALPLVSTVRPQTIGRLPAEGVYVFRFFDVRLADCDAIVALSREAWETFEDTDRYVRGRIVAALVAGEGLPDGFEPARLERALAGLERDGLVVRAADGRVRLP